ncbi:MAG: energy transducer TonB [Acidobacteriota bacterium]
MFRGFVICAVLVVSTFSSFAADRVFEAALRLLPADIELVYAVTAGDQDSSIQSADVSAYIPPPMRQSLSGLVILDRLLPAVGREFVCATRFGDMQALFRDKGADLGVEQWLVFEPREPGAVWEQVTASLSPGISATRTIDGLDLRDSAPGNELRGCLRLFGQRAVLSAPCAPDRSPATRKGEHSTFADSRVLHEVSELLPWPNRRLSLVNLPVFYERLSDPRVQEAAKAASQTQELESILAEPSKYGALCGAFESQINGSRVVTKIAPKDDQRSEHGTSAFGCDLAPPRAIATDGAQSSRSSSAPLDGEPQVITKDLLPPEVIQKVEPDYPLDAREQRLEGKVILQIVVREDGSVTDVKVLRSIELLDQAAVEAVRQWRYKPAMKAGRPVPAYVTVTVNFRLREALEGPR